MSHASIKIRDLTKTFALAERGGGPVSLLAALRAGRNEPTVREVRALEGISLHIEQGERVGIIGPNGAGKTTLLTILTGLMPPSSGSIEVTGDIHAMLSIGAVLRDDLTGRENIDLDASIHGRRQAEIDAVRQEIIDFTELGEFIDRPVRTYSSGMKARLAFSMGAFIEPDILIIDETLSVGDYFFAQKASRKMAEVASQGRIVIVVAHALNAIIQMCSRCLWLDHGRVVMDGDPKVVAAAYEQSVRDADEKSLSKKFGLSGPARNEGRDAGQLTEVRLIQDGKDQMAALAAMRPLEIRIAGILRKPTGVSRLSLSILRVDGRTVWQQDSNDAGLMLPASGSFELRVAMDPFILGADLYRLSIELSDEGGLLDGSMRVFEVIDVEGQFGGKPLLLCSPQIRGREIAPANS
ncbi:ABC transporter ATP-binding protein [Bradyrhizobium sp. INPA01-394B]|uniref:ABC transporter ATP-binding protein n=1 Tax=Bradyrhizobium campsiandrae TaxID=1729892 RepID=A0ABR7UAQ0_9BRAD|nr:ABC transporter ATP-binding protein [Bradyrhizobium campsiandrae]MBC9877517.1 ABC transporter ATP-binding protein [Bradyrhizobium campsiandrae]MBC9980487.1 ABC transporter ATP-binding protein [Bradyrhizobium campsiandrae]